MTDATKINLAQWSFIGLAAITLVAIMLLGGGKIGLGLAFLAELPIAYWLGGLDD